MKHVKKNNILRAVIVLCVFSVVSGSLYPKDPKEKKGTWPYQEFAYAVVYLYNLDNGLMGQHAVVKDGKLDKTVVGEGVRLTDKQLKLVLETTNSEIGGLIEGLSKTYIPHHGIVFYNQADKPVAYITICFDCEALRVRPEVPMPKQGRELTEPEINDLLQKLAQYKKIILQTGLPIFKTPFQYASYGK